jgi:hypothetical protein
LNSKPRICVGTFTDFSGCIIKPNLFNKSAVSSILR